MKKAFLCILIATVLMFTTGCPEALEELEDVNVVSSPRNLLFLENSQNTLTWGREADMFFPSVEDFGADRYVLYYSTTKDGDYNEYKPYGSTIQAVPQESPTVGFGIPVPSGGAWFKLLIEGGTYDGEYSNRVFAPECTGDGRWSGMSLDETVSNTGVIAPNVGYGLLASFTVVDSDDDTLTNCLDYQWYRIDPNNWEDEEAIAGATSLTYTTTNADRGYTLLIRASGKNDFTGGLLQQMSIHVVK